MQSELQEMNIFAPVKPYSERTINRSEIPHCAYT